MGRILAQSPAMPVQSNTPQGSPSGPAAAGVPPAPQPPPRAVPLTAAPAPSPQAPPRPAETGGPTGPEPTRFGDWERAGRCIDF
jgi:hypothetical protein